MTTLIYVKQIIQMLFKGEIILPETIRGKRDKTYKGSMHAHEP